MFSFTALCEAPCAHIRNEDSSLSSDRKRAGPSQPVGNLEVEVATDAVTRE